MTAKFGLQEQQPVPLEAESASNGEIVASGEAYPTKAASRTAIDAVKRAAASATVDDTTD